MRIRILFVDYEPDDDGSSVVALFATQTIKSSTPRPVPSDV